MENNIENGEKGVPANSSIISGDESTLYYSMNSSGDIAADLEETMQEDEEAVISVEIPDFSPGASLRDPLAICDKFLQKHALISSTPNRLIPPQPDDKVSPISGEIEKNVSQTVEESKDDTLQEKKDEEELTMKSNEELKIDTSATGYVSLKQILDNSPGEKKLEDPAEKKGDVSQSKRTEIVEIQEYVVSRVAEDLIRVVIQEETDEDKDIPLGEELEKSKQETSVKLAENQTNEEEKIEELQEINQLGQKESSEQSQGETSQPERVAEKDEENKENVNEKKQRRRSKIAVSTNQAPKEQKVTGKQSLIRRSIFKTEVKSPAKLTKPPQLNPMKRSSLLPRNLPAAQKRQTIAPLSKASAPLAKPNPVPVMKVHQPILRKRQTLAPSVENPSGSVQKSPKSVLSTKNPPTVNKSPKFLNSKNVKRQTLAPSVGNPTGSVQKSPKGVLSTKNPPTVNKSPKFLHPKDVKAKEFECKVCRRKFRTALVLETHAKTHKELSKSGYMCKYCDRRFEIKQGLENHIQKYCTKIPVGEKRRLLEEEAKNNALTPRTKRLIKSSSSASSGVGDASSASSSSDLMSLLKCSPEAQGSAKRRSVAFSGISATPNRTIKCYQCRKEFVDVFEFSDHITEHVTN